MKSTGQPARLLAWLRANPGASSIEITLALRIVNVTGRVSDLRDYGYVIDCAKDESGVDRYVVRERQPVTKGEPVMLPWADDDRTPDQIDDDLDAMAASNFI